MLKEECLYRFLEILLYMPELVGFQTMVILDPYGMTFDAVGVFGLDFQLLFKSGSSYCVLLVQNVLQSFCNRIKAKNYCN